MPSENERNKCELCTFVPQKKKSLSEITERYVMVYDSILRQ